MRYNHSTCLCCMSQANMKDSEEGIMLKLGLSGWGQHGSSRQSRANFTLSALLRLEFHCIIIRQALV